MRRASTQQLPLDFDRVAVGAAILHALADGARRVSTLDGGPADVLIALAALERDGALEQELRGTQAWVRLAVGKVAA